MISSKPKLTYFNYPGLGESIRLILQLGNIDFEDVRVSDEKMLEMQGNGELPTGQLPLLEVDEFKLTQSEAILRWAGKVTGFYPSEALLAARCDMVLSALNDVKRNLSMQWYGHVLTRSPRTSKLLVPLNLEQKCEVQDLLNTEVLPTLYARLESILGETPYFCGYQPLICDIEFYCMANGLLDGTYCEGIRPTIFNDCPKLLGLVDRLRNKIVCATRK